jgi:hypothetical protein
MTKPVDQQYINACRLYKEVTLLSCITNAGGTWIRGEIFSQERKHHIAHSMAWCLFRASHWKRYVHNGEKHCCISLTKNNTSEKSHGKMVSDGQRVFLRMEQLQRIGIYAHIHKTIAHNPMLWTGTQKHMQKHRVEIQYWPKFVTPININIQEASLSILWCKYQEQCKNQHCSKNTLHPWWKHGSKKSDS